jgi:peptidoglycan/xylan/chitin deacetylase (PgdA/CDA1 family)
VRAVPLTRPLVALTYDDGPSDANTADLLEILEAAGARATFFVVGSRLEQNRELGWRIAAGGHELANHSYSHRNLRELAEDEAAEEIALGMRAIAEVADPPALYRPPFGKQPVDESRICTELGLRSVLWSIDSGDTMPFSTGRIVREVVRRVRPGDIVLMHDGGDRRQKTLDATRRILDALCERGYRCVTVSELLALAATAS